MQANEFRTLWASFRCQGCSVKSSAVFPGFMVGNDQRLHLHTGNCVLHAFPDAENPWGEGFACEASHSNVSRMCPCFAIS